MAICRQKPAKSGRLAEATAFAIRIDVAEEITRLQSHLMKSSAC